MLKGDRVLVISNTLTSRYNGVTIKEKDQYVGHTGIITLMDEDLNRRQKCSILIKFDNEELEKNNIDEGRWYWGKGDLMILKEENKDYRR